MSTVWVCATRSTTFSALAVRNPGAETRIVYEPAGKYGSVYVPVDVVVVFVSTRVAEFVAMMLAPGTAAPVGSVTVPVTVPIGPCPKTEAARLHSRAQHRIRFRSMKFIPPPSKR